MDSARLNDRLQIVGMLGIIASLVFVGLQINQTQRVGEGEELANYVDLTLGLRTLQIDNAAVWRKVCTGEQLSDEDQTKAAMLMKAYLEFTFAMESATWVGIVHSQSDFAVNRMAANIHRYPGFAALAESHTAWGSEGEKGIEMESIRLFVDKLLVRLAELKEIEPNPDFDVKWCGI